MIKQVREVFTKKYLMEIEYREFLQKRLNDFKLNNQSEPVEDMVKRLKDKGFVSNFEMPTGGDQ